MKRERISCYTYTDVVVSTFNKEKIESVIKVEKEREMLLVDDGKEYWLRIQTSKCRICVPLVEVKKLMKEAGVLKK